MADQSTWSNHHSIHWQLANGVRECESDVQSKSKGGAGLEVGSLNPI